MKEVGCLQIYSYIFGNVYFDNFIQEEQGEEREKKLVGKRRIMEVNRKGRG